MTPEEQQVAMVKAAATPPKSYTEFVSVKQPLDESSRRWQLGSMELIEELRQRLLGKTYDEANKVWVPIRSPIMTEKGIGEICSWVSTYVNKNQILSYYEPREISAKLIDFEESLTFKFEGDWEGMGIDKQDLDMIFLMIADTVWASTNRARYGGEKTFIEGTEQKRVVETNPNQSAHKPGFFESIPGLGRR